MAWTREKLLEHLAELGIETKTFDHPPLFTVEESQALRGEIAGAHTKNLFLKCKKGSIWLVTALEDTPVNLKTLHKTISSGRLSFGQADLLKELLGVVPGSVSTFGIINDVRQSVTVVLDEALMQHETINLHPLVNTATTSISRDGLLKFLEVNNHTPRIFSLA